MMSASHPLQVFLSKNILQIFSQHFDPLQPAFAAILFPFCQTPAPAPPIPPARKTNQTLSGKISQLLFLSQPLRQPCGNYRFICVLISFQNLALVGLQFYLAYT